MDIFNDNTTTEELVSYLQGYAGVREHPHKPKAVAIKPSQVFVNGVKCLLLGPANSGDELLVEMFQSDTPDLVLTPLWGAMNNARYLVMVSYDGSVTVIDFHDARKLICDKIRTGFIKEVHYGTIVWCGSITKHEWTAIPIHAVQYRPNTTARRATSTVETRG